MDDVSAQNDPELMRILHITDLIFTCLFVAEMLVKMLVMGVIYPSETAFLGRWENAMDAFVALTAILSFAFPLFKPFRALRMTRVVIRSEHMKVVVTSIVHALPAVLNSLTLCVFLWMVFGILGVQILKGLLYYCTDETILLQSDCTGQYYMTQTFPTHTAPLLVPRQWVSHRWGFNHIGISLFTLFEVAVGEGWVTIMGSCMDTTEVGMGPQHNSKPGLSLYFVSFVVFGNFFAMALIVGILTNQFSNNKQQLDGSALLTDEQREWMKNKKRFMKRISRSSMQETVPTNPIRKACYAFIMWPWFDRFTGGLIVVNIIMLASTHFNQPQAMTDFLRIANLVIVVLFTLEAAFKMTALGFKGFFRSNWNTFDFVIVVLSYVGIVTGFAGSTVLRVFRIGRVFRLVNRASRVARVFRLIRTAKGLQRLFTTLLFAIPSLLNISLLLMATFFVFGVLGMDLFGHVQRQGLLDHNTNFESLPKAMLTLFQIATTETWNDMMASSGIRPENSSCSDEIGNCGPSMAIVYYLTFMLLGSFVMLNLFIAVVMENFDESSRQLGQQNTSLIKCLEMFRERWVTYDNEGNDRLNYTDVVNILYEIPAPVGIDSVGLLLPGAMLRHLRQFHIPIDEEGNVTYVDALYALSHRLVNFGENAEPVHQFGLVTTYTTTPGVTAVTLDAHHNAAVDSFQVGHALAASLIAVSWRRRRTQMKLHRVRGAVKTTAILGSHLQDEHSPSTASLTVPNQVPLTQQHTDVFEASADIETGPKGDSGSPSSQFT